MAKTQTIEIPDELTELFDKSIERGDRFVYGTVQAHKSELSRKGKEKLKAKGLFGFLSLLWATLDDEDKDTWADAGDPSGLTNWQLFISDNAARLRNDLSLAVPPSAKWQVRTGYLDLADGATQIKLVQKHPLSYWIAQKIAGKPWKRELVKITEQLSLPLRIGLSYKADLTASGSNPSAQFYARVWSSYQGVNRYTDLEIPFSAQTDWVIEEETLSSVIGYLIGYEIIFEIEDYEGVLFFDNLIVEHSEQNWARDPRADNVDKVFEKGFAVVRPFWVPEVLPSGATYQTVYPPALE